MLQLTWAVTSFLIRGDPLLISRRDFRTFIIKRPSPLRVKAQGKGPVIMSGCLPYQPVYDEEFMPV